MSFDIPAKLSPFVESLITSGAFSDEGAVVERALQFFKDASDADTELRRELEIGASQLRRGEYSPAGEVVARLKVRAEEIAFACIEECFNPSH
jgi:Arc/MetJ-type ribon-helix-helix transcriptional regulator